MFGTQGGGADGIGFVGVFFVADAQAEGVDEIADGGQAPDPRVAILQVAVDLPANGVQLGVQFVHLVELARLPLLLDGGGVAQPDVFQLAR